IRIRVCEPMRAAPDCRRLGRFTARRRDLWWRFDYVRRGPCGCLRAGCTRVTVPRGSVSLPEGGAVVARVARFEGVNVEAAEATMGEADAIIRPLVENLAGYRGHLDLVTADGKVLSITLFDSEEDAQAAEPTFNEDMPRQLGHLFKDWAG